MMDNSLEIDKRIKFLLYKIKNKKATKLEKNEYIDLLLKGGYIDNTEYEKYKKELKGTENGIGEALVGIGLAVLVGTLLSKLFSSK